MAEIRPEEQSEEAESFVVTYLIVCWLMLGGDIPDFFPGSLLVVRYLIFCWLMLGDDVPDFLLACT